jgi:hypothetical protein
MNATPKFKRNVNRKKKQGKSAPKQASNRILTQKTTNKIFAHAYATQEFD